MSWLYPNVSGKQKVIITLATDGSFTISNQSSVEVVIVPPKEETCKQHPMYGGTALFVNEEAQR